MARLKRVFAVHPGEILKTEFREPMGVGAYKLAKALHFPGSYEVVRGDQAISAVLRFAEKGFWPTRSILA